MSRPVEGGLTQRSAFALRPDLHFAHELAQLREHQPGLGMLTVECLDAVEPGDHGTCFFHVPEATAVRVSARAQLCHTFVAEQHRVELAQQRASIAVQQHRNEQPAYEIG